MWTIKGKEAQLAGLLEEVESGASLVYFVGDVELFTIEINGAKIEGAALVFNPTEAVSLKSGRPNSAVLSGKNGPLLSLSVPDQLPLEPLDVIAGATIKLERLIIQ